MKYSILVLGASISISLFIRICCSLEANLDQTENLFLGRPDEVYTKFLKFSLVDVYKEDNNQKAIDNVDQVLEEWSKEIEIVKKSKGLLHENPAPHVSSKLNMSNRDLKDEICGNTKPPGVHDPDCDDPTGCSIDYTKEEEEEEPSICQFNKEDQVLICKSDEITSIPRRLPPKISTLYLNETKIEKITQGAFQNVSIQTIKIFRNSIDYIHPWAFHDITALSHLMIVGNQLTHLAYDLYVGLNDTIFLDLQYNQISLEIYKQCDPLELEDIAKVFPKLRWLQFTGNPLKIIPRQMFAGLRESPVLSLYLDNCYLQDVSEDAFVYFKQLTLLNLSDNPSDITQPMEKFVNILKPLTSLTQIYLSNLGFSDFPMAALSHVSHQLQALYLNKNKMHTIKRDVMSKFTNLVELYLDDCSLQIIEDNAFSENTNLKALSLQRNNFQRLPAYFPLSLVHLWLSNNNINSLNSELRLHNMTDLRVLVLSSIKINRISTSFLDVPNLNSIHLKGCDIQHIDDGAFQDLKNLNQLYLDNNPIPFRSEILMGLDSLEILHMPNCGLTLDPPVSSTANSNFAAEAYRPFQFVPRLTELNLSSNKIHNISSDLFGNLTELCLLYLSDNPIEAWERRLFPDRITTIYDDIDENNTCFFKLFLQNGQVQFMKEAMFEDFLRVSTIDISNNDLICDEGACKLRDIIATSLQTYKQTWLNSPSYKCVDLANSRSVYISEVTDDVCSNKYAEFTQPTESTSSSLLDPGSSSAVTTLIIVITSLSLLTAVVILLAYRNRARLHYLWFTVKFNVMSASPRKAKLSTMGESVWAYEYDVFISYHHDDSTFIENAFLPEIELQDGAEEMEVFEAKNSIYVIEQDEIIKSKNNNNVNAKINTPRFKVCLHERDFAAGVPITENIVDCVDRSRKTVIFVSKQYMESQWCSYELNLTYHRLVESRRKSFLLVLMEKIPDDSRSKVLNYLMVSKTYLEWPGVDGLEDEKASFWKRLRTFLQS